MPCPRGESKANEQRQQESVGLDPDGFDVQVLFQMLYARLAAIPAHLVAAERDSGIHRLIAVYPHGAGAKSLRQAVCLAHVTRPHTAAETELRFVAALDHLFDVGEWDGRDHWSKDLFPVQCACRRAHWRTR